MCYKISYKYNIQECTSAKIIIKNRRWAIREKDEL
jgi:hypothetical protein